MSREFARVYEDMAHRITGPVSLTALDLVGPIGPGIAVLDIAAGTGALSVPAAQRGAAVTAVDISPGMVERLSAKLAGFPSCTSLVADGQRLSLPEDSFDATFSIFGVITFADWRSGITEQCRVTRRGGKGCVTTWSDPDGGGPFQILSAAIKRAFPDRPPASKPPGFTTLSDPERLQREMETAGFRNVVVHEIEAVWEGRSGQDYVDEVKELLDYIPSYANLSHDDRASVDSAMRAITDDAAHDGALRVTTSALIAVGTRN